MPFDARVLKVLIASPGDTVAYRNAIEAALHAWNGDRAEGQKVILLPRRWETDAVPDLVADGQSVINSQLVDTADIVFGVFHATLGSPTARAASGTAEELERSRQAGKRVHVYFSEASLPHNHDRKQLAALDDFKAELRKLGLYGTFSDESHLREKVRTALEYDVHALTAGTPAGRVVTAAAPFPAQVPKSQSARSAPEVTPPEASAAYKEIHRFLEAFGATRVEDVPPLRPEPEYLALTPTSPRPILTITRARTGEWWVNAVNPQESPMHQLRVESVVKRETREKVSELDAFESWTGRWDADDLLPNQTKRLARLGSQFEQMLPGTFVVTISWAGSLNGTRTGGLPPRYRHEAAIPLTADEEDA